MVQQQVAVSRTVGVLIAAVAVASAAGVSGNVMWVDGEMLPAVRGVRSLVVDDGSLYGRNVLGIEENLNIRQLHDWYSRRATPGAALSTASGAPGKNVVRVEVQEVIREMRCPANMIISGEKCIGRELCPPKLVCPAGTTDAGLDCVSKTPTTESCPPQMARRNGSCVKCDVFPADLTCTDPEESLDERTSACVKSVEVPPVCPPGFINEGNSCVSHSRPSRECPTGFTLERDGSQMCVKNSTVPAQMTCPEGAVEQFNKCIRIRQDPPRCPRGFQFDTASAQVCEKKVCEVPGPCPDGYQHGPGGDCVMTLKHPAEENCAPGYIMDVNGSCVRETPVPPRCPAGFQFARDSGDSICEKIVKEIPRCPEGATPMGHACQKVTELDMTQCCPEGYTMEEGTCKKYIESPPALSCAGECFIVKSLPVSHACPEGTEFVDDGSTRSARCVQQTMETVCPSMQVAETPSRCMKHKRRTQAELRSMYEEDPECFVPAPAATPCQEIKHEKEILAQAYCANGGDLENGECILRQPVIPEKVCKDGELDPHTEQCVKVLQAPMESKCPPNTIREGYKCIMKETVQPDFVCPDDSESGANGCCIVRSASIASAPIVSRDSPVLSCSSGHLSQAEKACVETESAPRQMVCPRNAIRNEGGQCVVNAPLVIPKPLEMPANSIYVCPSGVVRGSSCMIVDRVQSSLTCPPGSFLDGESKCARHEELIYKPPRTVSSVPLPQCPPGAQRRGTSCVSTIESEVVKSCTQSDFQLEGIECIKHHEKRQVCPAGMTLTAEGCSRDLVAPPTVEIIKGCMHDVTPACEGCPKEIVTTCSSKN